MINYKLNIFLKSITLKKQYIKRLKSKMEYFEKKKKKTLNNFIKYQTNFTEHSEVLIKYIIDLTFSKSNILLHVSDSSGNLIYFCSAGVLKFSGKSKKAHLTIVQKLYKILIKDLDSLHAQPLALHLTNAGSSESWIIKLFKLKFFIKATKVFSSYPYNGCRKKKLRRKKVRTSAKKRRNG